MRPRLITLICSMLFAAPLLATSFIVPTDDELISKSSAIAIGTVEGSYVQETENTIETVYELRIERAIKGLAPRTELLRFVSPGGIIGDRGVIVPASAHFNHGDRVVLFLIRENGRWETTDMTLGKFRFVTSTTGERLLVRDMEDVVGWDHRGRVHREKVRREAGFLRFIDERVRGRAAQADYEVEASAVTIPPAEQDRFQIAVNAPFSGATYSSWANGRPTRWANISAGVTFRKRADQNISGLADGGVSVIQGGLAAWTNECGSVANLIYGGTTSTASAHFDGQNVVEFNDPQSRVSGSWTGSGTIAITFNSFTSEHSFAGQTWWSIGDADVVFQNGYPGTHGAFDSAMTHELGHGIGFRHSNQNHQTGGACNSAVEECTSAAIMNSSVGASYDYRLQPWDVNAVQSIYPGGSCGPTCNPPVITAQPQSATVTGPTTRTLSVSVSGTAPFTSQWYTGASGNTSNPISGATSSSISVTPSSTTSYWVRVSSSCGTVNSASATITVNAPPPPPPAATRLRTDFDGDGRSEFFWNNPSTGANMLWFVNGASVVRTAALPTTSTAFRPEVFGDFNGDGRSDIMWRNSAGANYMWLMNGTTVSGQTVVAQATSWNLLASGDFDGDGKFDIFWRNTSTGAASIWFMNGPTVASSQGVPATSPAWSPVAFGDFNGDGKYDIFWRNASGGNYLWLMNGAAVSGQSVASMPANWSVIATGDFNADGRFDIWWRDPSNGANRIWLMNGASRTEVAMPAVSTGRTGDLVGDFNADRHHDIIWRSGSGANAMWLIVNARVSSEATMPVLGPEWRSFGMR